MERSGELLSAPPGNSFRRPLLECLARGVHQTPAGSGFRRHRPSLVLEGSNSRQSALGSSHTWVSDTALQVVPMTAPWLVLVSS